MENAGYKGPLPGPEFYGADQMKEPARVKFLVWHESARHLPFDFDAELRGYCMMDVEILQLGVARFRQLMIPHSVFEPFEHCVTIASLCNRIYRAHFMQPRTLALIPEKGYYRGNQSRIALSWLELMSRERGVAIAHAGNEGEVMIEGALVDGFTAPSTVWQFHGCLFHGCPDCWTLRDESSPCSKLTFRELYNRTMARTQRLRTAGYEVVEEWECAFAEEMKGRKEELTLLREFSSRTSPIGPREALFGGRTSPFKMHHRARTEEGEKILYYDFTSLYPYVQKTSRFPEGHPQVLIYSLLFHLFQRPPSRCPRYIVLT